MKWKSNLCASLGSPLSWKWRSMAVMGRKQNGRVQVSPLLLSIFILCIFSCKEMKTFLFLFNFSGTLFTVQKCNFKSETKYFLSLSPIISVCQQKYTHKPIMFTYGHTVSKPHCALQCDESFCIAEERKEMGSERWETFWAYDFPFCTSDLKLTEAREQVSSSFSNLGTRSTDGARSRY